MGAVLSRCRKNRSDSQQAEADGHHGGDGKCEVIYTETATLPAVLRRMEDEINEECQARAESNSKKGSDNSAASAAVQEKIAAQPMEQVETKPTKPASASCTSEQDGSLRREVPSDDAPVETGNGNLKLEPPTDVKTMESRAEADETTAPVQETVQAVPVEPEPKSEETASAAQQSVTEDSKHIETVEEALRAAPDLETLPSDAPEPIPPEVERREPLQETIAAEVTEPAQPKQSLVSEQTQRNEDGNLPAQQETMTGSSPAQQETMTGSSPAQQETMIDNLPAQQETMDGNLPAQQETMSDNLPAQQETMSDNLPAQQETMDGNLPTQQETMTGSLPAQQETMSDNLPTQQETIDGISPDQQETMDGNLPTQQETMDGNLPAQQETMSGSSPAQQETNDGNSPAQQVTMDGSLPTQQETISGSSPAQQETNDGNLPTQQETMDGNIATEPMTAAELETPTKPDDAKEAQPMETGDGNQNLESLSDAKLETKSVPEAEPVQTDELTLENLSKGEQEVSSFEAASREPPGGNLRSEPQSDEKLETETRTAAAVEPAMENVPTPSNQIDSAVETGDGSLNLEPPSDVELETEQAVDSAEPVLETGDDGGSQKPESPPDDLRLETGPEAQAPLLPEGDRESALIDINQETNDGNLQLEPPSDLKLETEQPAESAEPVQETVPVQPLETNEVSTTVNPATETEDGNQQLEVVKVAAESQETDGNLDLQPSGEAELETAKRNSAEVEKSNSIHLDHVQLEDDESLQTADKIADQLVQQVLSDSLNCVSQYEMSDDVMGSEQ